MGQLLRQGGGEDTTALASAKKFDRAAVAVEAKLVDLYTTGRSEDIFVHPMQLYGRLSWLITELDGTAGGGSAGGDLGPTAPQTEVNAQFRQQIASVRQDFERLVATETPAFNAKLKAAGVDAEIAP